MSAKKDRKILRAWRLEMPKQQYGARNAPPASEGVFTPGIGEQENIIRSQSSFTIFAIHSVITGKEFFIELFDDQFPAFP